MKGSMLQTWIVGIGVLQGFLGLTAVSYADTTLIVSKSGPYFTINDAVKKATEILSPTPTEHVTIQVQDSGPYYESVYVTNIPTSSSATLTLEGTGGTIILAPRVKIEGSKYYRPTRPIHVGRTDFVTIRGFIFQNDLTRCTETDAMTGVNFDGYTPSDSQITFDNCVWDGQNQTYGYKAILFCWQPHCNITVQNSTFQNVRCGTNLSLVYLGARSNFLATVPTFTFRGNQVINNIDPEVQIEGNPTNGYYHNIIIQGNDFRSNEGDYNLVVIRNQRAGCDIGENVFYQNTSNQNRVARPTLALENSGNANIHDNYLIQNNAEAEVFVQTSAAGTTVLTGNTIAASEGSHYGVWAALSGNASLQSSENVFYSNYNKNRMWNEPTKDLVAYWATDNGQMLTISQWNGKTPNDGVDSLAALGERPPTP